MIDAIFYWIGVLTFGISVTGFFFVILSWAIDRTVKFLNLTQALYHAYFQYLKEKKRNE